MAKRSSKAGPPDIVKGQKVASDDRMDSHTLLEVGFLTISALYRGVGQCSVM